jgi:hypothetical protein
MRLKNIAALACLALGLSSLTGSADAAPVTWNIVSSASSISLAIPNQTVTLTSTSSIVSGVFGTSLTFSMRAANPGTGSWSSTTAWTIGNRQNISGTIESDTDFTSNIQFLAGSNIDGIDSGSYAPLADGSAGTASADFGTHIFADAGLLQGGGFNLDLAFRNALYDLLSGSIPVAGGEFAANQMDFGVDNADLSYRARNGFGVAGSTFVGSIGSGAVNIGGLSTDNINGGNGNISVVGSLATLTLPITQTLVVPVDGLWDFELIVSGNIVATAVVPEPATVGMLAVGMAALTPLAVRRWRKRE